MITWERIFTALSHNSTLPFMLDHLINFYGINNVFSAMLDSRVIVTKDYKEHTFVTDDESLIFNTGYTVFVPDSHYWQVTDRYYASDIWHMIPVTFEIADYQKDVTEFVSSSDWRQVMS